MTGVREEARRPNRPDAGSEPALLPRSDRPVTAGIVVIRSHTQNLFMVEATGADVDRSVPRISPDNR
jgi:hypothetical protein